MSNTGKTTGAAAGATALGYIGSSAGIAIGGTAIVATLPFALAGAAIGCVLGALFDD